ncbi:MAG: glycosyltransferase family 2 protein [Betaproteobacteria bacterium]|nr:glycosyltransferase family 2 protein [Betaproteobacteria bacterium]
MLPLPPTTGPTPTSTAEESFPLPPSTKVAVVIPCYRCKGQVMRVLQGVGPQVWRVFVVDDACPEGTGAWVQAQSQDPRVAVVQHTHNQGVGAAVMSGYAAALTAGAHIIVKIDGDGQMDPSLIARFVNPIVQGRADYTKGNRFFNLRSLKGMPRTRLLGNAGLSFLAKLSTGYWSLFDVTNGYTAIHARLLPYLEMDKVSRRYFFETDLLFRLGTLRAAVVDVPMEALYADERSNLKVWRVLPEFAWKNLANLGKRIAYNYFLRDLSVASLELVVGAALLLFGVVFGLTTWSNALATGLPTPLGTIMLAALPTLVGLQMLLAFMGHDVAQQPQRAIHPLLPAADSAAPEKQTR